MLFFFLLYFICISVVQVKEAKANSFKNKYARDPDAGIERARTYHLNDEEETEIEKEDTADGIIKESILLKNLLSK